MQITTDIGELLTVWHSVSNNNDLLEQRCSRLSRIFYNNRVAAEKITTS